VKELLKSMGKAFAITFGVSSALIVLLYAVLGAFYVYKRVERQEARRSAASLPLDRTFIETFDTATPPTFVPDAELRCEPKDSVCSVLINARLVAFISREQAKNNLAGLRNVPSQETKRKRTQ